MNLFIVNKLYTDKHWFSNHLPHLSATKPWSVQSSILRADSKPPGVNWESYNNNNNNIISKFIKCQVCLQKAAEALVRYRSDGLVTAIKQECLKMSFKTMFQIAQDDFCRQTVPNDRCGIGE